jgi:ABC-type nitrate/sulfonate/bicarbonate transport system ATPase subunit
MASAELMNPTQSTRNSSEEQFTSLEFRGLGFRYGTGTEALRRIDFTVRAGELVTVLGPSGCGKSTLFNLASGLARATSGEVLVNDATLSGTNPHVAYMFQHDALLDWRTVLGNVTLGAEFLGVDRKTARAEAMASLADFGLEGFENRRPYELSGGMRQRVALLRTYATKRPLLLLDEPFGALDALTRLRMQEFLLRRWEGDDRTVLFITHDVDEALMLGDRVVVLSERPASVVAEIPIDAARPRDPEAMAADPEIAALKSRIMHMLRSGGIPTDEQESIGDGRPG